MRSIAASDPGKGAQVWALVTVSSEAQSETLPHQLQWAREAAATHGWSLVRVIEGVASGKHGPRRLVSELIANLRTLEPDARPEALLMIRADRVGRGSIVESQIVLRDLEELGVSVFTRDQGFVRLNSAMAELISAATLAVAAHENEVRSEKMTAVYRRRRDAGVPIGNRPPYGLSRENGALVPDGSRAAIVRQAFKLRLKGLGYDAIGKRVRSTAPPQAYRNGRSHVVKWTATRVMRMLTNRHYIGVLVSEADFAKAQRVAETLATTDRSKDRRRRWPWPLAGSIRCYCGRAMIGIAGGQEPWRIRYYGCRASWSHNVSVRLVRADALERQFALLLSRLRASPELIERYRRRAATPVSLRFLEKSVRELKSKLAEVDHKRDTAWDLHVSGKIRSEDMQERLDTLAAQRNEIQGRIASDQEQLAIARSMSEQSRDVVELFRRAPKIFSKATEPEQRTIARAVALELGGLHVSHDGDIKIGA